MLIVGAFFFLTLPDCIVSILITYLAVYDPKQGFDKYRLPQNIFMFMAIFNSSINPLLYGEWRKLLLCKPSVGNQSSTPLMMRARTLQRKQQWNLLKLHAILQTVHETVEKVIPKLSPSCSHIMKKVAATFLVTARFYICKPSLGNQSSTPLMRAMILQSKE